MLHPASFEHGGPRVSSLTKRIHGWSWQGYTIGIGTGAVYVTLSGLKHHPSWLTRIEIGFFFLNIGFFLLNSITLSLQAIFFPKQAWRLIQDPMKGIFLPFVVLSFATIAIGMINYALPTGHIRPNFVYAIFWVYTTLSLLVCYLMLMIWFNKPHDLTTFNPTCAFLIFPLMVVGTIGANVLRTMDPTDPRSVGVLLTSYLFQGLGFFMTFIYIIIYIIRIMITGFLDGHQANGALIACGPPGFTALALIELGEQAREILPAHNLVSPQAGEIWYASSILGSTALFGLSLFLFFFSVLPWWFKVHKQLDGILSYWALTFSNVGWIATLRAYGDIFDCDFLFILHLIMAIVLCIIWLILFVLTIVACWKGFIFQSQDNHVIRDFTITVPYDEKADTVLDIRPHTIMDIV